MNKLLVYEKTPLNASVLARATGLELNQVRSLSQLSDALSTADRKIRCVGIEVAFDELASVLGLVQQVKRDTDAVVIAMPTADVKGHECLLYEAGVDLVFCSMRDRDRVVRLMRAKLAGVVESEGGDSAIKSRIWSRLPWKRHATGGSS